MQRHGHSFVVLLFKRGVTQSATRVASTSSFTRQYGFRTALSEQTGKCRLVHSIAPWAPSDVSQVVPVAGRLKERQDDESASNRTMSQCIPANGFRQHLMHWEEFLQRHSPNLTILGVSLYWYSCRRNRSAIFKVNINTRHQLPSTQMGKDIP